MDEILKKLLQSELLSEETKAEISEQWTTSVESFKTQVREEVSADVRLELGKQWISEREELVNKVDSFITEALEREVSELKDDIEGYRDLQVEYAEKLVEEKQKIAEGVAQELDELVDKIDAFFEVRLTAEIDELREDLDIVKQNEFGRKIYEAFASTYSQVADEDSVQNQLVVAEAKLADVETQLKSLSEERNKMVREAKMDQVLSSLTGTKREQMAMVLRNVETSKLEESYKSFIGRILKEEKAPVAALNEGKIEKKTTVVTGEPTVTGVPANPVNEALTEFRRIAGLK